MTNNLDRRKFQRFLKKNGWDILDSTNHSKISFKNFVDIDGIVKFKTSKMNTNFNCNPIKADLAKQVRDSFEAISESKITDQKFEEAVNKCKKIIKVIGK